MVLSKDKGDLSYFFGNHITLSTVLCTTLWLLECVCSD